MRSNALVYLSKIIKEFIVKYREEREKLVS